MVKSEWGKKRICPSCSLKYYDFNRSPITCPSCKAEFDPDLFLKSRKVKNLTPKSEKESLINEEDNSVIVKTDSEQDDDDDELLSVVKDEDNDEDNDEETDTSLDIDNSITFIDDEEDNEDSLGVEIVDDEKE